MLLTDVVEGGTYMWDGTDGDGEKYEPNPRPAKVLYVGCSLVEIDDPNDTIGWMVDANSLSPMPKD